LARKKSKKRSRKPNLPKEALQAVRAQEGNSFSSKDARGGFNPDYSYVVKDLKRIAFLAGFFIALLIVLSFYFR
jgi:hypothetical protein